MQPLLKDIQETILPIIPASYSKSGTPEKLLHTLSLNPTQKGHDHLIDFRIMGAPNSPYGTLPELEKHFPEYTMYQVKFSSTSKFVFLHKKGEEFVEIKGEL